MWSLHDYAPLHITSLALGYTIFILPLLVLYALSMYWLRSLVRKTFTTISPDLSRAQLWAVGGALTALIAIGIAAIEQAAPAPLPRAPVASGLPHGH